MSSARVMVIGLDCAAPELVFGTFAGRLPHFDRLRASGCWGRLESIIPPITVPAWASMTTGRDPGELGIYGFRNRQDRDYESWGIADASWIEVPHVWDRLGAQGRASVVLGVPPSFPPRPIHGCQVGCFLTPDTDGAASWTHPMELASELHQVTGGYQADVAGFRTENKQQLLTALYEQSEKQFLAAEYLARNKPWDLFMMVNIALDRFHHGFWRFFDPAHRRHEPGHPLYDQGLKFYQHLDGWIGRLQETAGPETNLLIVSDHGAKRIDGGIAINQWLMERGLLALNAAPDGPTPVARLGIDWSRTQAWSEGGYYARVFINLAGREPQGIVRADHYEALRRQLAAEIAAIPDDFGRPLATRVYRPEELYRKVRGVAPDLLVLFGDLHWRSVGSVGHPRIQVLENDTGPDDANHAQHGLYILNGSGISPGGPTDRHLLDVAPTLLRLLKLEVPADISQADLR